MDSMRDAEALALFDAAVPGAARPEFVLGQKPLWQPLIPAPGGRWQPHELAYDPAKREWFNVFGKENRHAGEWGHWSGRGMNWNSMCAQCHMTGYQPRYDPATDAYASTWVEHGVSCIQCHGPTAAGHGDKARPPLAGPKPPFFGDRAKIMQTCAPCHARNEPLTDRFQPGDSYHDHYRIVLPVDASTYYPDGQQRDEDFNWTSVLLSRMGRAGVTCMDCHDPHTCKTILPVPGNPDIPPVPNNPPGKNILPVPNNLTNRAILPVPDNPIVKNQLCLQCHAAPGRTLPSGIVAVTIDPLAHSKHQPGSAGNSCVACHMPTTTYMQRAPRHDHAWLSPDPLMTKELGIPNACSRCHQDKGLDWNIAKTSELFGTKVLARQRARARAILAAQTDAPNAAEGLLALLKIEDIPAWRATFLSLLPQTSGAALGHETALASLKTADPLERAAAVACLTGAPNAVELLTPLLKDPVRLVRIDAAWALSPHLPADSPERRELDAYLSLTLDQPSGRLRLGQDKANRGDLVGAEQEMSLAVRWDPFSPAIRDAHGMVLAALGRSAEAGTELYRAAELAGAHGGSIAFRAGLAFGEAGRMEEAQKAFRLALECDPKLDRAWYNLGLLQAQMGKLEEAAAALGKAETLFPTTTDYPYALATVLLRASDREGARAAARRVLSLDPANQGALQILRRIGP